MSRAAITVSALLRSAVNQTSRVAIRTTRPTATVTVSSRSKLHASSPQFARSSISTNTISVDPRILDGTSGLLSKDNVDRLIEWQTGLWERLASEVRNNPALLPVKQKWDERGLDMTDLLVFTSRDPSLTLAFNYASALINNSYFLEGINPSDPQQMPQFVESNAEALKEKVEAYAEGIIGSGWLWLVRTGQNSSDLDIIPTFGSGTLLITQKSQIGREDTPLYGTPSSSSYSPSSPSSEPEPTPSSETEEDSKESTGPPPNQRSTRSTQRSRSDEMESRDKRSPILPVPLAVLNLHEMAYLGSKYGVWDRKRYAADWFNSLDWSKVSVRSK